MRRWSIFVLIGPLVGFLVLVALGGGFQSHAVEAFLLMLPFAMVAGVVPAIITASFDYLFEKWGLQQLHRLIGVAIVGYGAAYLLTFANLAEATPLVFFEFRWGLVGAVPAVICSWLSGSSVSLRPSE
ncbi:DUF5413 family protein [Bradyrhizobium diazoefficiens]|nr:DUF5413 family protein [Bradyrhizobium diazoefficiens]MBR0772851.1 DUF5413 family protein [Bradyrhizobium diazoefficiens]